MGLAAAAAAAAIPIVVAQSCRKIISCATPAAGQKDSALLKCGASGVGTGAGGTSAQLTLCKLKSINKLLMSHCM